MTTPATTHAPVQPDLFGTVRESAETRRLSGHLAHVRDILSDGEWHTPREVAALVGCSDAAVTARFRDLRKQEYGGHNVVCLPIAGVHRYRMEG